MTIEEMVINIFPIVWGLLSVYSFHYLITKSENELYPRYDEPFTTVCIINFDLVIIYFCYQMYKLSNFNFI
jgi:hypothetical protein